MDNTPFDDATALQIVKLINDLDRLIQSLQAMVPPAKPWQRQLKSLLGQADRCMQILRMTEAMEKPDQMIGHAAVDLKSTCRKLRLAIQGSRADAVVRQSTAAVAQMGDSLAKLITQEVRANSVEQP